MDALEEARVRVSWRQVGYVKGQQSSISLKVLSHVSSSSQGKALDSTFTHNPAVMINETSVFI